MKNNFIILATVGLFMGMNLIAAPTRLPEQQGSFLNQTLSKNEAVVWYLGHCGYAVKTKSRLLIFDYQEKVRMPDRSEVKPPVQRSLFNGWVDPEEIKDLDVLVFVSHSHSDHFDPIIFSWEQTIHKIEYVFGWQEREGGRYHSLPAPRKTLNLDGVEIYTVNSHHSGVPESGFLVKLDGLTLFHQGDYIGRMGSDEVPFTVSGDLNYLKKKYDRVDIYFTHAGTWKPQPEMMASFRPRLALPMHYGYREEKYTEFLAEVKEVFPGTVFFIPQKKGDYCHFRDGALVISTNPKHPINRLGTPPKRPELFLPGLISGDQHDFVVRFRPGMDELYLMRSDAAFNTSILLYRLRIGRWHEAGPASIPFDGQIAYPTFSADGQTLFFDGLKKDAAPDIWTASWQGQGWTKPVPLGPEINGPAVEMLCSVASNGNIYFSSNRPGGLGSFDIYFSRKTATGYAPADNMGPAINSAEFDAHPFIAPDESYLLFDARRSSGMGQNDIYISFRKADNSWSQAQILAVPGINTQSGDMRPYVSLEGKAFFFCSDRQETQDIFWTEASFIEELRREELKNDE